MIYVTQGHEKGIGLEIFFKSFIVLSKEEKKNITLVINENDLNQNFTDLKLKKENFKELNLVHPDVVVGTPSSTSSLLHVLGVIKETDILVTLPTSKDQLIFKGKSLAGYTEFFRSYYNNQNISMTFKGINQNVLLVTDHVALKDVTKVITKDLIVEKTNTTIEFYKKYFSTFDEIIFSGINPHVGENGILGNEDKVITLAIDDLKKKHILKFSGPFSGDTLHMHSDSTKSQLFVYMFHDQGLAQFKALHGLIGLNISMGLPFLRLSVDHGTAFELYGKNKANASGLMFLFKQAFEVHKNVNKRN
ncbi:MAG: 4-hydroxythreonine-4-phosphate dehydrogenase PdxA [Bdellovibrionales bacterium]|nr:4-hydroxythreonine-4-phosphate dehydrogenase PdxA [Bdellovibrionales bacterium]